MWYFIKQLFVPKTASVISSLWLMCWNQEMSCDWTFWSNFFSLLLSFHNLCGMRRKCLKNALLKLNSSTSQLYYGKCYLGRFTLSKTHYVGKTTQWSVKSSAFIQFKHLNKDSVYICTFISSHPHFPPFTHEHREIFIWALSSGRLEKTFSICIYQAICICLCKCTLFDPCCNEDIWSPVNCDKSLSLTSVQVCSGWFLTK